MKINKSSKSISSNSISSIEINTSKIYEVVDDENINENTIIDDDLDINYPDLSTERRSIKIVNSMPSTDHPIPKDVYLPATVKPPDPNSNVFQFTNYLREINNLPSTMFQRF